MTKTKTTTAAVTTFLLIIAAIFLAALPRLEAQQSPAPAPTPPPTAAAPSPEPPEPSPTPPEAAAPSPGVDCFSSLINLADCLSFVEEGSNLTEPDSACCPEIGDLVKNQPICLCELLNNSSQFGISIDVNKALKLPSLCRVQTPPVSLCAAVGIPIPVPAPAPSPSAETPSQGNKDNAGPSNLLPSNQHLLLGLTLVLFTHFI